MTISLDTVILDIMGALQNLAGAVPGIVAPQPSVYPTALDTLNGQTFVMTWPGAGENWQKGAGYTQGAPRTYRVLVFLEPVAQSDIPTHTVAGAVLLQQLINIFVKSSNTPLFSPSATVPYQATIQSGPDGPHITDGGLVPTLSFRGVAYFGFEISVPVRWQAVQT